MTDQPVIITFQGSDQGLTAAFTNITTAATTTATSMQKVSASFGAVGGASTGITAKLKETAAAVVVHSKANNELLSGLKELAGGFTLLDGPLGGVASRFRTLGTLSKLMSVGNLIAATGLVALGAVIKDGIEDYVEQEEANKKLATALEATGRATGDTVANMIGLSMVLAKTTPLTQAQAAASMAMLATFKNIPTEGIKDVVTAASGLASLTGKDLTSSVLQLGKALEDPVKSLDALRRAGIIFTESEKELLKVWKEEGDTVDSYNLILGKLGPAMAVAADYADTFAGKEHVAGVNVKETAIAIANASGVLDIYKAAVNSASSNTGGMAHAVDVVSESFAALGINLIAAKELWDAWGKDDPQTFRGAVNDWKTGVDNLNKSIDLAKTAHISFSEAMDRVTGKEKEASPAAAAYAKTLADANSGMYDGVEAIGKNNDALTKQLAALRLSISLKQTDAAVSIDQARIEEILTESKGHLNAAQSEEIALLRTNMGLLVQLGGLKDKQAADNAYAKETKNIQDQTKALQQKTVILQTEAAGGNKLEGEELDLQLRITAARGKQVGLLNQQMAALKEYEAAAKDKAALSEIDQEIAKTEKSTEALKRKLVVKQEELKGGNKFTGDAANTQDEINGATQKAIELEKQLATASGDVSRASYDATQAQYIATEAEIKDLIVKQQLEVQLENIAEQQQQQKELLGGITTAAEGAFSAFLKGGESTKKIFYDMTIALEELLVKMALFQPLDKAMMSSNFFGSIGSFFTGGAHAQGNIFSGGSVQAFASGGIVDGATAFPMSSGTGLMGEAGPEAIIPLTRTAGGDLGIRGVGSMGGQSVNMPVSVVVNHTSGGGAGGTDPDQARKMGDMIADAVSQNVYAVLRRETGAGGLLQRRS